MTVSIGRNDPCHCGSGKKYKKCCLEKDELARARELAAKPLPASEPASREPLRPKHQHAWQNVKGERGFRLPPPPRRGTGG
jgi:hypothetical protein